MMTTTLPAPITAPITAPMAGVTRADRSNPWLLWRPELPHEPQRLTVAELAECRCPDLCDRDHANE
jgi:hypothetical protein